MRFVPFLLVYPGGFLVVHYVNGHSTKPDFVELMNL